MKKLISIATVLSLVLCLFAGCGSPASNAEETTAPMQTAAETEAAPAGEAKITDGIYFNNIDMPMTWYHFNEDGTYYAKLFEGSMLEAGVWELVDEGTEHYEDANGNGFADDEERDHTVVSPQTIITTPYSTGVPNRLAYENDTLMDITMGGGISSNRFLIHDPAYAYNPDVDEIAIQLFLFYANNDIASNFILNHNRTFEDVTGDVLDPGTWEMTGEGEYALTYDFGGSATLTVDAKGTSAVLTKDDGTTVELRDTYKESGGIAQFMSLRNDEVTVPELPMSVAVRIDGYSDGTCQLIVEVAAVGAELVADQGTYEVTPAMVPTFHFDIAGDIEGTADYANATENGIPFTVAYSAKVSPEFQGTNTDMTMDVEVTGIYNPNAVAAEPKVVASLRNEAAEVGLPMTVAIRVDCLDDGTAQVVVEVAQVGTEFVVDQGTYEISPVMEFTFSFEKAGELTGMPDYGTATDTSIEVNMTYTADVEVEFNGSATPLSIAADLNGVYSIG